MVIYVFEDDNLDVDLRASFSFLNNEKIGNLEVDLSVYDRLSSITVGG
jgi:hypothetical protein